MFLIILQWNSRSLTSNGQEFKKFVENLSDKPHVICVQETWLKPQWDFVMYGYTAKRNDRETGNGGGVATFVKNGVSYNLVKIGKEQESIVIKVWSGKSSITIVNYYNPCNRLSTDILKDASGPTQGKVIWCGDFNAHSTLWGSNNTDANGSVIEEFIDDMGLVCINDGRGTRYNSTQNTESVIDLTLTSTVIAGVSTWDVLNQSTVGSDHYPILVKVGIEIHQEGGARTPRWKLDEAEWGAFQIISEGRCVKLLGENMINVEEMNGKLVTALIQTAEETIPKSRGSKREKSVPWWDDNCSKAIKKRNRAFRQLKAHHTLDTLIEYKRALAVVRKTIRLAKRTYWRQYCNKIGRETQLAEEVWGMIRKMNGIKSNFEIPVMHSNNITAVSTVEKAELLAKTFVQVHSSGNLSVKAKHCRDNTLAQQIGGTVRKSTLSGGDLDLPFTLFELRRALLNVRQTSPGKDGVCYSMLAHLTDSALEAVLRLFNNIWDTGKLPSVWKQSVIVPILKPGKDSSNPSSYRPIALTSQLGKTMERLVTERLSHFLESKNLLSNYQSGFRKGRGTMDSVLCLESEIRKAQTNREMVIAVFFDVEKAYDMLWKEGLLIKLKKLGVNGKLHNWVLDFMFGRTIEIKVGTEYSKTYQVENGTPQGSVCSPILFNVMINDIFEQVERGIGKSLYADDGALWIRGRNLAYIQKKLQAAITTVEQWADKWGFKFSVAKTQCVCFSRRHKEVSLKLYGQKIEQVSVVRLLGVWLDEKMTWKQHIDKVRDKCKRVNNLLRCLSGRNWGATRASLLNIYQAIMRATLDYGCIGYLAAADSHLKKLDVQQTQGLRICSGAFKSSPVAAIQVEMGEQPLQIRRVKLLLAYWVNLQGHSTSHPAKAILEDCWEHNDSNIMSFGWIGNIKAAQAGLGHIQFSPTVPYSCTPPWLFIEQYRNN